MSKEIKGRNIAANNYVYLLVHDCDNTALPKERIHIGQSVVHIHAPVCHGMKLYMLSCNCVEPEKNDCFLCGEIDIIQLCLDKTLCV